MLWTVPMLLDPNKLDAKRNPKALSDSTNIVEYLDRVYPEKKLIPTGTAALIAAWECFIEDYVVLKIYRPIFTETPRVLGQPSRDYFYETREKWWGPLDQICPDRKRALEDAREGLNEVATV